MVPRTAHQTRSLRQRLTRRGAQGTLPVLLILGGTISFNSPPASAATSPSTDTVSVVENGTTTLAESLPPDTPDVVTPVATAFDDACTSVLESGINGAVQVCYVYPFGPAAGTINVVGVQPSVGVLLPRGLSASPPNCGVVILAGTSDVFLAPPGTSC
jgi:hypothetical protein